MTSRKNIGVQPDKIVEAFKPIGLDLRQSLFVRKVYFNLDDCPFNRAQYKKGTIKKAFALAVIKLGYKPLTDKEDTAIWSHNMSQINEATAGFLVTERMGVNEVPTS